MLRCGVVTPSLATSKRNTNSRFRRLTIVIAFGDRYPATMQPATERPRKIGLIGWSAIVFSSFTLCAAALLLYLVATTENHPPPKLENPPSDPMLIAQEADNRFLLPIEKATLEGKDLGIEQRAIGKVIGGWKSEDDRISWRLKLRKDGIYEVHLTYSNAGAEGEPAGKYQFQCGEEKITASARATGGVEHSVTDKVFLKLGPQGEITLELSAISIPGGEFMALKSVELLPRLYQRKKSAAP